MRSSRHVLQAFAVCAAALGIFVGALVIFTDALLTHGDLEAFPARDWTEIARGQELRPCYSNTSDVRLHAVLATNDPKMPSDRLAEIVGKDRIIPEGPLEGEVIPQYCFAVAEGIAGERVAFWQRPYQNGGRDMTIPYWTGPE